MVCPPAVAIPAMYIVPHGIMYLWRNCCRMAHLMSNTDLVAVPGYTHCATICPTRTCSDLSPYVVQAIEVFDVCLLQYNLCAPSRMTGLLSFANIISRLKRICGKRTGRMTSFGCHMVLMFPWMHNVCFFVYMEALVRVLLCLFLPY